MIHIYQRHCNVSANSVGKSRPDWFSRENCFANLLKTTSKHKDVEITIMFDGEPSNDHFINKYSSSYSNLVTKKGGDDAKSFLNVVNYVAEQNHSEDDIVYFLEDDYMHTNNWVDIMLEGFDSMSVDYITLYDHNDKYFLSMYEGLESTILVTPSTHWRTTPSTTNTYACKFSTFQKHLDIHKEYCDLDRGFCDDHNKFTRLWKEGSNLISSIPGCSTHVETEYLSPVVNWGKL